MAHSLRSRFCHRAVYLAVRSVICLVQTMPLGCALRVARALAWLAYRFDKRHRLVAADNLRHAFPDSSEQEIDTLVRAMDTALSARFPDISLIDAGGAGM